MARGWRTPGAFLVLASVAVALGLATWQALINNFAVERASFTGREIGLLQSLTEAPGFLVFTSVFVLLVLREQTFAIVAMAAFGVGIASAGFLPAEHGLYFAAVLMSVGFHYFETLRESLMLQWLPKDDAPHMLGRLIAVGAAASLAAYGAIAVCDTFAVDYRWLYLAGGGIALLIAVLLRGFPHFSGAVAQRRRLILRKRYWLYYGLTFLSGARRQIFVVFAGFLMVERFGYSVTNIALLMLVNHIVSLLFAERIGAWIGRVGERRALTLEYAGLILVFTTYAFVDSPALGAALYIIDHLCFALAIAIKTYFQKIADPADFAATASVSLTINHIAAVVLPAVLGLVWLQSPAAVFLIGAVIALGSLVLAQKVPERPCAGNETVRNIRRIGLAPLPASPRR